MTVCPRLLDEARKPCAAQRLVVEQLRRADQAMFQNHRLTGALFLRPYQHFDVYADTD